MKNHRVALGFVLLLAALGVTLDGSLALEMDKIET
jgi:hypothetical protein